MKEKFIALRFSIQVFIFLFFALPYIIWGQEAGLAFRSYEKVQNERTSLLFRSVDHTGNVGQFSMANEPSLHIPYLYAYAGKPWMTQKRVKELINQWFRSDLMGIPGDEDGGGMSAFVVFSMIGFYPVTPGLPVYTIGTPFFKEVTVQLSSGKTLKVTAPQVSKTNKYIQKAWLNDSPIDRAWITHEEIIQGGVLHFEMGDTPNKE